LSKAALFSMWMLALMVFPVMYLTPLSLPILFCFTWLSMNTSMDRICLFSYFTTRWRRRKSFVLIGARIVHNRRCRHVCRRARHSQQTMRITRLLVLTFFPFVAWACSLSMQKLNDGIYGNNNWLFQFCPCHHRVARNSWTLSRRSRNRAMHALFGNGAPSGKGARGKGKAQAKQEIAEMDPEAEFARLMREAIPEAARIRSQPQLLQEEWDQPTKNWQHLDGTGGVAICPKDALPSVLTKVGFTSRACAVVIVQEPDTLHLQGYPRSRIRCTFNVCTQGADRQQVTVERWLVQLGFADSVQMTKHGDEITVGVTMRKMTAKCSKHRGWQEGPIPAGILSTFLDKHVSQSAYADIQSRMDGSFTFQCHEVFCETLLRASGKDGIFIKMHGIPEQDKFELFWMDRSVSLADALKAATESTVCGLAEKGQQGLLALRFQNHGDLVRFAKANQYDQNLDLQRWKISGLPSTTGIDGITTLLESLNWEIVEVLYQDADHAVYTATKMGKADAAHFRFDGQPRTVRFKALNAEARKVVAAESQSTRRKLFQTTDRAQEQKNFLAKVTAAHKAKAAMAAPSSPRNVPGKQKATDKTGETPEGQKARQG
jgi:hypothetical protein